MKPDPATQLARAFETFEAGRVKAAGTLARKILKQAPSLAGAHYLLGLCTHADGEFTASLYHLKEAERRGPDTPALRLAIGRTELALGHVDNAILALTQAADSAPTSASAQAELGLALTRAGRSQDAVTPLRRAIELRPTHAQLLNDLGAAFHELGYFADAFGAFEKALAINPDYALALRNYGIAKLDSGDGAAAIPLLRRALAITRDDRMAAQSLGLAFQAVGNFTASTIVFAGILYARPDDIDAITGFALGARAQENYGDAAEWFERAAGIAPDRADLQFHLGEAYRLGDKPDLARAAYLRSMMLDAEDRHGAAVGLSLLAQEPPPDTLPPTFVAAMFDGYAGRFNHELVDRLEYRGPEMLLAALGEGPCEKLTILDLGCGTGLSGELFRPIAATLEGVDLSPRMIEQAHDRAIYDRLTVAEIGAHMAELNSGSYDLLLAADVLVYIGDLKPIFDEAFRVLRIGGRFAFSLERRLDDDHGFVLQDSRRYAHGRGSIRALAEIAGFTLLHCDEASTRLDRGEPVPGLIVVLGR
jgi:predicted TPR repeat methyltransferase